MTNKKVAKIVFFRLKVSIIIQIPYVMFVENKLGLSCAKLKLSY